MKTVNLTEQEMDALFELNKHRRRTWGFVIWFHSGKTKFIPFGKLSDTVNQRKRIESKYGNSIQYLIPGVKYH